MNKSQEDSEVELLLQSFASDRLVYPCLYKNTKIKQPAVTMDLVLYNLLSPI